MCKNKLIQDFIKENPTWVYCQGGSPKFTKSWSRHWWTPPNAIRNRSKWMQTLMKFCLCIMTKWLLILSIIIIKIANNITIWLQIIQINVSVYHNFFNVLCDCYRIFHFWTNMTHLSLKRIFMKVQKLFQQFNCVFM